MNPPHGLPAKTVEQVSSVVARFPEVQAAVLFGSRAKGTHKPGSDIDLSLVGEALDWRTVGKIYDALDDLLLPYRFSLIVFDPSNDPDVAAHIARVGIPLFQRERAKGWPKQQAGANGSPEKLLAILAEAPDVPPMPGDEVPPAPRKRRT